MLEEVCNVLISGVSPVENLGGDVTDQVIIRASCLPKTRSFRNSLEDIRERMVIK